MAQHAAPSGGNISKSRQLTANDLLAAVRREYLGKDPTSIDARKNPR
jgi:hypothetical protein